MQLGGIYRACIRSPEGKDHWMQGIYHEIIEPERLIFSTLFLRSPKLFYSSSPKIVNRM
ncbi:MAG: SRPBCC domain-containing protein [Myxacorys californica WJT36-NPBG1]|nr:SRPBCC domain-containing protein [Myxacorys californica WJT36-NPBG1]